MPVRTGHLRLLIITHDLQRTGAPLVMLAYARWLSAHGHDVCTLALGKGDLDRNFAEVGPLTYVPPWVRRLTGRRLGAARPLLERLVFGGWIRWRFPQIEIVHANTITCGLITRHFAAAGKPVVTHVHELSHWIENRVPADHVEQAMQSSNAFVCVSEASKRYLSGTLRIDPDRITVISELIPTRPVPGGGYSKMRTKMAVEPGCSW